ncbi:hypothetical protein AB0A98_31420, partial [Streptomyces chrestomyceticus]
RTRSAGRSRWGAKDVDQALVIVLSGALEDEQIRYSELRRGLWLRGTNIKRTAEILDGPCTTTGPPPSRPGSPTEPPV